MQWTIVILDATGTKYELVTKVAYQHTTSISICWEDVELPSVGRLISCFIFAQSPLFRDAKGNAVEHRFEFFCFCCFPRLYDLMGHFFMQWKSNNVHLIAL